MIGGEVLEGWRRLTPEYPDVDGHEHRWVLDVSLPAGGVLEFQGLATWCVVLIDGRVVAEHRTMFRPLFVTVPAGGGRVLEIRSLVLAPERGGRRARWRNRLVAGESLRGVRTTLLGRMAGTGAVIAGPYRPAVLHRGGVRRAVMRATLGDGVGVVVVRVSGVAEGVVEACGHSVVLRQEGEALVGTLRVPDPPLWWPHTHGTPALVEVRGVLDGEAVVLGRVGFRTIGRAAGAGFGPVVNGVPVFCRGAVWMGGGAAALERMRDAGLNMVRVPGFTVYPDRAFLEACDALGVLLWQDFMFSRFDYPADEGFLAEAAAEAAGFLDGTAGHPCVAVLCGGDETVQAAVMAGRPASEWGHALFDRVLAGAAAAGRPDVPYVTNAPSGGELPIGGSAPVSHFFGVGAYLRPLADAAGVRFAAACLAFSNPADPAGCRALCGAPGDGDWAASVPRDPGLSWTFEDVRDHYVGRLFGADAAALRRTDPEGWLAVGRAAVALAMQSAMSTWRADPACGGALVLALQDRVAGPGWGVLDHRGRAKSALHALAAVCRPVQVLLQDRGLDGVVVHLVNDTGEARRLRLVVRGLSEAGIVEVLADAEQVLGARAVATVAAAALMGRFRDLVGAWRFGTPPYVVLGAALLDGETMISESVLFPQGPALGTGDVGLAAKLEADVLTVAARGFAQFVAIDDEACVPDIDHFHLWPGEARRVRLSGGRPGGSVRALNGVGAAHYR